MPIASTKSVFGTPAPPPKPKMAGTAKRIEPVATKAAKPKVKKGKRDDIKISLMAEMMDGTVQESEITVANPSGVIRADKVNSADHIFDVMKAALTKTLGVNHVK